MNRIILFLLCIFLIFFLFPSCNSLVGLGVGAGKGNLNKEKDFKLPTRGAYVEYRWKKMIPENSWSKELKRHGYGIDYNMQISDFGGIGTYFHSIQGKYYYTLLRPEKNNLRMDLSLGLGYGRLPFISNEGSIRIITNLTSDFYFQKNEKLYLSTKINYINDIREKRFNLGFEVMIGIRINE